MNSVETALDPEKDLFVFMDETWYTNSGAMKVMKVKQTTLCKEIKEKRISVFRHPQGNLFSKEAIAAWAINRTTKAKR